VNVDSRNHVVPTHGSTNLLSTRLIALVMLSAASPIIKYGRYWMLHTLSRPFFADSIKNLKSFAVSPEGWLFGKIWKSNNEKWVALPIQLVRGIYLPHVSSRRKTNQTPCWDIYAKWWNWIANCICFNLIRNYKWFVHVLRIRNIIFAHHPSLQIKYIQLTRGLIV